MSTFILRLPPGAGLRIAIKDLIDLAGTITTAGCRAVAVAASPATRDAACLGGIRAAEKRGRVCIVGKTNLHELAYGVTGINPWYGTPVNPIEAKRAPGGSSSGSAVAVADGDADIALGTDTGGSIRMPAACCGVTGLKTTWGRISLDGIRPLGPSLDSIGPMARQVGELITGMSLLEPGFRPARDPASRIGRVRLPATDAIDQAIDNALATTGKAAGTKVMEVELPGWLEATEAGMTILCREAWEANRSLLEGANHRDGDGPLLGADVNDRLWSVTQLSPGQEAAAQRTRRRWRDQLARVFERVDLLAMPVLAEAPPKLDDADRLKLIRHVMPVNVAGVPALAMPLPTAGFPASLQLIGPAGGEEKLLATGALIEALAKVGGERPQSRPRQAPLSPG